MATYRRQKRRQRSRTRTRRDELPYTSRGVLLSRGELAFYRALRRAAAPKFLIAFKVRAADLLACAADAWEEGFGHMVAKHHLDFVLCDPISTAILAAIELDDKSHALDRRKRRDKFLNGAFAAANIPLVRFKARAHYNPAMISETLSRELPKHETDHCYANRENAPNHSMRAAERSSTPPGARTKLYC